MQTKFKVFDYNFFNFIFFTKFFYKKSRYAPLLVKLRRNILQNTVKEMRTVSQAPTKLAASTISNLVLLTEVPPSVSHVKRMQTGKVTWKIVDLLLTVAPIVSLDE